MVNLVSSFYSFLGINIQASMGDVAGLGAVVFFILSILAVVQSTLLDQVEGPMQKLEAQNEDEKAEASAPQQFIPQVNKNDRLAKGLEKSRNAYWGKLISLLSSKRDSDEFWDEAEELLYSSDMGAGMIEKVMEQLKDARLSDMSEVKHKLYHFLRDEVKGIQVPNESLTATSKRPHVIMFVGVNGAGKTTTIGKFAALLKAQGKSVVLAACDTFRAAAVDQLETWASRSNAHLVKGKDGADPSGVAFDSIKFAKDQSYDYCLIDTAGRLHTKQNLMEELAKTKRVLSKIEESAPHDVFLVLDAVTGQSAMKQAKEFNKYLDISGIIFTKCDGSSKAGNAVSIVKDLEVPIRYIGVGEGVEDIQEFSLETYLKALLDLDSVAAEELTSKAV